MMWDGSGMSSWGYVMMTITSILFWTLVIAAAVIIGRRLLDTGRTPPPPLTTPEDVLAMRLARGEIDEDEYEMRMATLRGRDAIGPPRA